MVSRMSGVPAASWKATRQRVAAPAERHKRPYAFGAAWRSPRQPADTGSPRSAAECRAGAPGRYHSAQAAIARARPSHDVIHPQSPCCRDLRDVSRPRSLLSRCYQRGRTPPVFHLLPGAGISLLRPLLPTRPGPCATTCSQDLLSPPLIRGPRCSARC
jgi:hypothetical protein